MGIMNNDDGSCLQQVFRLTWESGGGRSAIMMLLGIWGRCVLFSICVGD